MRKKILTLSLKSIQEIEAKIVTEKLLNFTPKNQETAIKMGSKAYLNIYKILQVFNNRLVLFLAFINAHII